MIIDSINDLYSVKQQDVLLHAHKRWNGSIGATRSGKTYFDVDRKILNRIANIITNDYEGNIAFTGRSYDTIERNVVKPLQKKYPLIVSRVFKGSKDSITWHIKVFNRIVYLFPASSNGDEKKVQGDSFAYVYSDELTTHTPLFFDMLKSRLDKGYSICDFTCNPENSNHWVKKFIDDENIDKHITNFCIDDNPFLDKTFVDNLKKEYEGTVFYDRYILGKWVNAEGIVFPMFANSLLKDNSNYNRYMLEDINNYRYTHICIGVDFGGTKSKTVFTASGIYRQPNSKHDIVHVLDTDVIKHDYSNIDGLFIAQRLFDFYNMIRKKYTPSILEVHTDHETTTLNTIRTYFRKNGSNAHIDDFTKVNKVSIPLNDYIRQITSLFNYDMIKISPRCDNLIDSLNGLLYDDKKPDMVLDNDRDCDVDSYDSFRYSISQFLIRKNQYRLV